MPSAISWLTYTLLAFTPQTPAQAPPSQTPDSQTPASQVANGVVFVDSNNNGTRDDSEVGLAGIRVSNGHQIVTTDDNGNYKLPVDDDTILFVIKPSGYRTPLSKDMLPRFYYVHKPAGSPKTKFAGIAPTGPLPKSVDFPLYKQDEPKEFQAILFGDPQPRSQQEVDWIAHDIVEELVGTQASFGVTLGDIVFDNLSVMEPLNRTIGLLGIPWYNIIGNHDLNLDSKTRKHVNETFERIYGPSYYSFDHGPVHFLVVDNIEWIMNKANGKMKYRGGIGEDQLAFIKKDLSLIPDDQLVVIMMHVPLTQTHDRQGLYRLIEKRKFCMSVSGHTHTHEHVWIKKDDGWEGPKPHHHVINVTVSGSWWSGAPDERGIPHTTMTDGAPNGYSIISFDGEKYKVDFRAAGRSKNYQVSIHAPEVVKSADSEKSSVFANVFNGSERTRVEMRIGESEWTAMRKVKEIDPKLQSVFDQEAAILKNNKTAFRALSKPKPSTHLWRLKLPANAKVGTHWIDIRATEPDGRVYSGRRVLRVN